MRHTPNAIATSLAGSASARHKFKFNASGLMIEVDVARTGQLDSLAEYLASMGNNSENTEGGCML